MLSREIDGATPFSKVWHSVDRRGVPVTAVWLSAFMSFSRPPGTNLPLREQFSRVQGFWIEIYQWSEPLLKTLISCLAFFWLQSLRSSVAFQAMVSISGVAMYSSYGLPVRPRSGDLGSKHLRSRALSECPRASASSWAGLAPCGWPLWRACSAYLLLSSHVPHKLWTTPLCYLGHSWCWVWVGGFSMQGNGSEALLER